MGTVPGGGWPQRRLAAAAAAFTLMSAAVSGLAITTAAPAVAEANGVGATPAMGWSSWSFIRHDPTAADIEAQAAAMASSLDIANAATWAEYSNGWRTGGDIECYCGSAGSSYPLTDWSNVQSRFATCGPAPRRARRPEASARRER